MQRERERDEREGITLCNKKKKQKSCLSEFFSPKSFVVTQNNFPPSWFGWEDSFSLPYITLEKSNFGLFRRVRPAVYNTVDYGYSLRVGAVGFITVFWPLLCSWFDTEVPMGAWSEDTRTPVVIMAKYVRNRALQSRFSNFKNCFWRKEWEKNSGKNSRCSSYSDLSFELLNFKFRALEGPESRGL